MVHAFNIAAFCRLLKPEGVRCTNDWHVSSRIESRELRSNPERTLILITDPPPRTRTRSSAATLSAGDAGARAIAGKSASVLTA